MRTSMEPTTFGDFLFGAAVVAGSEGEIGCINAAGYLTPGAVSTTLRAVGIIKRNFDNTDGAVGDIAVPVMTSHSPEGGRRVFPLTNSGTDPLTQADLLTDCYIAGPNTVAQTDGGGTLSRAGRFWGFDREGKALVEFT